MVLDIVLFRESPELIREIQKRRYKTPELVDQIIEADKEWKKARYELDQSNGKSKKMTQEIFKKNKGGEDTESLKAEKAELDKKIEELEVKVGEHEKNVQSLLRQVGNIVHASVPVSDNEDHNAVIRQWGDFKPLSAFPGAQAHWELLARIDGYEPQRGSKVSGHRAYFLKGPGVRLNLALQQYSLDFLAKRQYTALLPPFFMEKDPMSKTAQLEQFDEELYKVVGGDASESHEKYLIATSEQPISALHMNEQLEGKSLPLRYAGVSSCFRKEAGAYGKDVKGIFRVHQFDKVEQFCITAPEKSWEMHEEMLKNAEDFLQTLGIPYRVVVIVSGALNNAASKKYDIEGWFPSNEFRELVSCSNCTDYQSRSLNIKYGTPSKEKRQEFVHMLNSTLCACTRVISAILEHYQTETGVRVPEVLKPYMGGIDFIPFVHKEVPTTKGEKAKKEETKNPGK